MESKIILNNTKFCLWVYPGWKTSCKKHRLAKTRTPFYIFCEENNDGWLPVSWGVKPEHSDSWKFLV